MFGVCENFSSIERLEDVKAMRRGDCQIVPTAAVPTSAVTYDNVVTNGSLTFKREVLVINTEVSVEIEQKFETSQRCLKWMHAFLVAALTHRTRLPHPRQARKG